MTTLREAAVLALKAIEQGETFGYLENVVAPTLEFALKETYNFCPRCGKRSGSAHHVHTCTPPDWAYPTNNNAP